MLTSRTTLTLQTLPATGMCSSAGMKTPMLRPRHIQTMKTDHNLYAIWREIPKTASFYLNKVDSEDGGVFLDGAAFRMWDADKQSVYFVKSGNTYTYTADSSASGATDTLTSVSSDKAVQIVGLPVGVYYLEETAAPTGYTADNVVYKLVVGNAESAAPTTSL